MKKRIALCVDYAGGPSCIRPEGSCDYMMVVAIPEDAPVEDLYVEVNPEEIPGEGHYEGEDEDREWVFDNEWASESILYQLLAAEAMDKGFEVLYCGPASEAPEDVCAIEIHSPHDWSGRVLIVSYEANDEEGA